MNDELTKVARPAVFNVKPSLAATKKLATELTKFIDENKLALNIANKKYVMVEGWQFAGSQLGLTAIPTDAEHIPSVNEKEIKYKASADLIHVPTGTLVSKGFAICSNQESKKKTFDEFAVASMAQTRAIGKAYRNNLSWLMKLAGFEGTPKEEITDNLADTMESELKNIKANVFKAFKDAGINDSEKMLEKIQEATGKQSIDNTDDAMAVLAKLQEEGDTNQEG